MFSSDRGRVQAKRIAINYTAQRVPSATGPSPQGRADFARVLIVASELAAASRKVYDVFDEPGSAGDDRDIALQLEAVP